MSLCMLYMYISNEFDCFVFIIFYLGDYFKLQIILIFVVTVKLKIFFFSVTIFIF